MNFENNDDITSLVMEICKLYDEKDVDKLIGSIAALYVAAMGFKAEGHSEDTLLIFCKTFYKLIKLKE